MIGPEPNPNTVYRVNGETMLYIRTERRPGAPEPEHLFIKTDRRTVFQVWLDKMPPEAELIVDEAGRREAEAQHWLRLVAEHDVQILFGLLKRACAWLPKGRADELRAEWMETRP